MHEESQHSAPFRCRFCNSFFTVLKFFKVHLKRHARHRQQIQNTRVPDLHNNSNNTTKSHHNNNNYKQSHKSGSNHNFYTPKNASAMTTKAAAAQAVQNYSQGLLSSLYGGGGGGGQKQLACKYCGKSFGKFSVLRKHEMLHKLEYSMRVTPDLEPAPQRAIKKRSSSCSSSALTLTPSLLSNLNKLAHLRSGESNDGSKPAILININTNDAVPTIEASAKKSQEMPLNSNSGLMISSVSSVDKNYFEALERRRNAASNATVYIQNGKKAVSLSDLQCPICKKIVSQPFSLKVHLRTHTLEK
jgi:hypothetical protein